MSKDYIKAEKEAREFESHLNDMLKRVNRTGRTEFSYFIDEGRQEFVRNLEKYHPDLGFEMWGGYENSMRRMLCIYDALNEAPKHEEYPMSVITLLYPGTRAKLTHRDFLGSLMGLNIERRCVGDIIICEDKGEAQIFALDTVKELILSELFSVGRSHVEVHGDIPFELEAKQNFEEINSSVSSLRVDSVIKSALPMSREKAAELIRQGRVILNGIPITQCDKKISEGDVFSVSGFGKFRLKSAHDMTKKGKIRINIEKFK